jgi:hypothetical protein
MATIVQSLANTASNAFTTAGVTAGNGMIVIYFAENAGHPTNHITSITDTQLNTWVAATGTIQQAGGGAGFTEIWYCASALSTAANVVSVHEANATANAGYFFEILGSLTQTDGSGTTGTGSTGNPVTFTSPTISSADGIFVAVGGQINTSFGVFPTIAGPWTLTTMAAGNGEAGGGYLLSSGSQGAGLTWAQNWSGSSSEDWAISIASFSAGSASTPAYVNVFCQS